MALYAAAATTATALHCGVILQKDGVSRCNSFQETIGGGREQLCLSLCRF